MKLVSLCPSITKLLVDLDLGQYLVGVTPYCIHPAAVVDAVEKVGGTKDPKLERIRDLAPDWVFLNREENRLPDALWLQEQGVRCHTSHPCTVDDTLAFIDELGRLFGRNTQAAAKNDAIRAARARLHAKNKGAPRRFAYLIWRKPWMTVNGTTYISNLIAESGAENVFADAAVPFPTFEADELAACAPDMVLLSSEPFPFKQKHIDELAGKSGLAPERFHLVDGELFSWHAAFTAEGLDALADMA